MIRIGVKISFVALATFTDYFVRLHPTILWAIFCKQTDGQNACQQKTSPPPPPPPPPSLKKKGNAWRFDQKSFRRKPEVAFQVVSYPPPPTWKLPRSKWKYPTQLPPNLGLTRIYKFDRTWLNHNPKVREPVSILACSLSLVRSDLEVFPVKFKHVGCLSLSIFKCKC